MAFSRFRALVRLLAALCVAGSVGFPVADAVLDHPAGAHSSSGHHVEGPGGCGHHTDHCLLNRFLGDFRLSLGAGSAAASPDGLPHPRVPVDSRAVLAARRHSPRLPRAPPANA